MTLDDHCAIGRCIPASEVVLAAAILTLLFTSGTGLVAAAQRPGSHAALLERLGGLMLVSGFLGLGFALAQSGG